MGAVAQLPGSPQVLRLNAEPTVWHLIGQEDSPPRRSDRSGGG